MKKMKKGLMLLSALFLAAGIAGCGEVTETPKEDPKDTPDPTPTPSEVATTSIVFNDLEGSGTLASPYQLGKVKLGGTASSPYLVSPSDATSKTVTWTVGKLTNGAFVADTTLGVTVSDPQGTLLTVSAAENATLGTTYVQGTCGSVTIYLAMEVTDISSLTSWTGYQAVEEDWDTSAAPGYRTLTEGFGLWTGTKTENNETITSASATISNKFDITADNARMTVNVRRFGQDSGRLVKLVFKANGTAITPVGYTETAVPVEDIDTRITSLVYDLSDYIGQAIEVTLTQPEDVHGTLVITSMKMDQWESKDASTLTTWEKTEIINDWKIDFAEGYLSKTGVGEGFDLYTEGDDGAQFIYNYLNVTADTNKLTVRVRRFGQDSGNANQCKVVVNGKELIAMGYEDTADVLDISGKEVDLAYDLSEFIGEKVQVVVMQPAAVTGHLVLTKITQDKLDKTASTQTSWTSCSEIENGWHTEYADYRTVSEGLNMHTWDNDKNGTSYIYNYLNITADTSRLVINARRFSPKDYFIYASLQVYVNGVAIKAAGYETIDAEIPDIDTFITSLAYDLSDYVGQTVQVVIKLPEAWVPDLVLTSIEQTQLWRTTASEKTSWNSYDEITADWSTDLNDKENKVNEGLNLKTNNKKANGFIVNYLSITESTNKFVVKARRFSPNANNPTLPQLTVLVNGTALTPMGYSTSSVIIPDVDTVVTALVYDLSDYIGKTVEVVVIQNVANVEYTVITSMELGTFDTTASTQTKWASCSEIADDWNHDYASQYRTVDQGFDLNTYDNEAAEFIYNYLNVTESTSKFVIKARRFSPEENVKAIPTLTVYVNGVALKPDGYDYTSIEIPDEDTIVTTLMYDLSAYIGQKIQVVIMQSTPKVPHTVITSIEQMAWDTTASTKTSWNSRDEIAEDWNIEYASDYRDYVDQGFDLNTNDKDANEFIYNYITVTEENKYFTVKVRRFGQDGGKANAVLISVNGKALKAIGQDNAVVSIADTDGDITTLVYDLSEYVGQTVRIVIMQPVAKTGHLVITELALEATAPTPNQDS
jgi:hypothetical protein